MGMTAGFMTGFFNPEIANDDPMRIRGQERTVEATEKIGADVESASLTPRQQSEQAVAPRRVNKQGRSTNVTGSRRNASPGATAGARILTDPLGLTGSAVPGDRKTLLGL